MKYIKCENRVWFQQADEGGMHDLLIASGTGIMVSVYL